MAPGRVARWYEMHLLDELGQRPEVDRCVECDRVLEAEERFRWVPPLGGILCERCPGPAHDRTGLSLEALKLLKAYQRLDIEAISELRLAPAIERETEAALRDFVRTALERDARSLAFLDEVRTPHLMADDRAPRHRAPRPTARPRWRSSVAPGPGALRRERRTVVPGCDRRCPSVSADLVRVAGDGSWAS